MLDYGCGSGDTVALGRSAGLDIWGADTFAGYHERWGDDLNPAARDRVVRIDDQRADFPDAHFDVVVSNQVLEHVTDPERVIFDVLRLLRPGGLFVAAFPIVETWYEGHVGLYFAHRLRAEGSARRAYFDLCHRLGFGLYREGLTRAQWIEMSGKRLDDDCRYYPLLRIRAALERAFGGPIEDISVDYMRARLGPRERIIPPVADALLRFIYHIRAGQILKIHKST